VLYHLYFLVINQEVGYYLCNCSGIFQLIWRKKEGGHHMTYQLKHFDSVLLEFEAIENSDVPEIDILWVDEECNDLLPLDMEVSSEGIAKWLKNRAIPKSRAYARIFLSHCGLHINRSLSVIAVCRGLSLNDCYWVVQKGFNGTFEECNLYDNKFSRVLAWLAFTGYVSNVRSSLASSPEFTTNGMLPKCWRRINGKIMLYKAGSTGASNAGNEPYSEYYAAQIAHAMGIDAIPYNLSKFKSYLCSACELFTSKERAFIPVGRLVGKGGFSAVREYYKSLGNTYVDALNDMIVFDAVICNEDRHFGNFGFYVDNRENKIIAPAPLFDHGLSLFCFAGTSDLSSEDALSDYVDTLMPRTYDDFIGEARKVMTDRHREMLRHLLTFRFKKHPSYNLPAKRLKLIESQVQKRARLLLER